MVTHELDIARYCQRNLIMRDGRLVSDVAVADRFVALDELRKIQEAEAAAQLTA
jgi:putative ABC transport system ATP-binding protein